VITAPISPKCTWHPRNRGPSQAQTLLAEISPQIKAEEKLFADYRRAEAEYNRLADAVRDHFQPLCKRALEAKDEKLLLAYLDECPEHVMKCFIMDMIRQIRKGRLP
jgi:hypothetical protein